MKRDFIEWRSFRAKLLSGNKPLNANDNDLHLDLYLSIILSP